MAKDLKTGDEAYKGKGLKKVIGWIRPAIERRYIRAAARKDWKKTRYYSYWLTIKAPK